MQATFFFSGQLQYKALQLVGVTAMWIACKYEEMFMPDVTDFVFITDQAYDTKVRSAFLYSFWYV